MSTVSVDRLRLVVDQALQNDAYARRLFEEPHAIAAENGLSDAEKLVVMQMNREQFETARRDAARSVESRELGESELEAVAGGVVRCTSTSDGTASQMILGRSIIAATGGSYADLTKASCTCCAWKGGISRGGAVILPGP